MDGIGRKGDINMSISIRLLQPHEYEQAIALSNATFRTVDQKSMGEAFPQIFSSALGQSFGAFVEDRLVSFMGLVPSVVRIGPSRVHTYSLGAVCTHPDYRGRGLASELMACVIAHTRASGASLLFVSGNRPLYSRFHCVPFGTFLEITLERETTRIFSERVEPSNGTRWVTREVQSGDWFTIAELANARPVRFETSVWEISTLLQADAYASCFGYRQHTLIAERAGQACGFLTVGVPTQDDVQDGMVIEWAGDFSCLMRMMEGTLDKWGLSRVTIHMDPSTLPSSFSLPSNRVKQVKNQGTVAILDAQKLYHELEPYLLVEKSLGQYGIHFAACDESTWEVLIKGRSWLLAGEKLVSFLFAKTCDADGIGKEVEQLCHGVFPIPLPHTGGLNYV